MATLQQLFVHPIKALDPADRSDARIGVAGGLVGDRCYAIVDADGEYVNGKRTADVHRLRAAFDPALDSVTLESPDAAPREFDLEDDRADLEEWLSAFLGYDVTIERRAGGELTDGAIYGEGTETGPTLVSRATLEEVASWFDGIDAAELRRRMRPNLVVGGVPAFWEDGLLDPTGDAERVVRVGDAKLAVTKPIPRCVVPTRDSRTGAVTEAFQAQFLERREETFPEWAPRDAFDHLFSLTVGTRVLNADEQPRLATGDGVGVVEPR